MMTYCSYFLNVLLSLSAASGVSCGKRANSEWDEVTLSGVDLELNGPRHLCNQNGGIPVGAFVHRGIDQT